MLPTQICSAVADAQRATFIAQRSGGQCSLAETPLQLPCRTPTAGLPLAAVSAASVQIQSLFCRRFCQREFAPRQWARYTIAANESGLPSTTMYASSPFTTYINGLSPVTLSNFFLPLTRPQMASKDWPNEFFLITRFMSKNSADVGSSIFAATAIFAFFRIG